LDSNADGARASAYCPEADTVTDGRRDTAGRRSDADADADGDTEADSAECSGDDSAVNTVAVNAEAFAFPASALDGCKGPNCVFLACRLERDALASAGLTEDGDDGGACEIALKCGDASSADRRAPVPVP
jgi:hypothetical protein